MKTLLIWGTGGPANHIVSILEAKPHSYDRIAFIHDSPGDDTSFLGHPIIGNRNLFAEYAPQDTEVFPAGSTPAVRKAMVKHLKTFGFHIPTFIDPTALIRSTARIGEGCLIEAFTFIDHNTEIGDYVRIGNYASVAHDCRIGDYCSLYYGSRVLGYAQLEEGVLMGGGSYLFPRRIIQAWSKVSMQAAVFEDLPAYVTAAGNPAQISKRYPGPQKIMFHPI